MVLPLIIAAGVTIAALTAKSAIGAISVYKSLSPSQIAKLNGITLKPAKYAQINPLQIKFASYPGGFRKEMTESEALLILDIDTKAEILNLTHDLIRKKHRRAMFNNHPDKGGSKYLSMKINEAKEILENSHLFRR